MTIETESPGTQEMKDVGVKAAIVGAAMKEAWDEICSDTGHHPDDITHEGKLLYYDPGHWSNLVAMHINAALSIPVAAQDVAVGQLAAARDIIDAWCVRYVDGMPPATARDKLIADITALSAADENETPEIGQREPVALPAPEAEKNPARWVNRLVEPEVPAHVLKAFEEKYHRNYDLTRYDLENKWGNTNRYEHHGIQLLWEGWRDSYLTLASPPSVPTTIDADMIERIARIVELAIMRHGVLEIDLSGTTGDAREILEAALGPR